MMKFHRFLTYTCFLVIVCCLSTGCDLYRSVMVTVDDSRIPEDPDKYLPEIVPSPTLAAGKFRIRVDGYKVSNSKLVQIHSTIGDIDERVKVIIHLNPAPPSRTPDDKFVLGYSKVNDAVVLDVFVVEITGIIKATESVYEYEGIAIKNLSRPEILFEYADDGVVTR